MRQRKVYSTNKSGTPGVTWSATHMRWVAYICVKGRIKWLGYFDTLEKAIAARKAGEDRFWRDKALGVSWHEETGKWIATVSGDGEDRFIGFYATRDEAIDARKSMEEQSQPRGRI